MGQSALLATLAATLVAGVSLLNADFTALSSSDSQSRDEEAVLAERTATSAFEMATSQLKRDFSWRVGYAPTQYMGGTFTANVSGPVQSGPVRITADGTSVDTLSMNITGWITRLAAASGALTIESDTASVALNGSGVLISGNDHRASSWSNTDVTESEGMAEPVIGLLAARSGTRTSADAALGADADRVRGTNGDGDVALGGLPSDFATLLGEAVGARTHTFNSGRVFAGVNFGSDSSAAIVHVKGDATFVGGGGFGLLYVEGSFKASSNFVWEGIVIADGENQMDFALTGDATIRGAAYVTHTSTINRSIQIGGTQTPSYTLWSPDDERGTLRAYTFGADGAGDRSEGTLAGWTGTRPQNGDHSDAEAVTFGPDGTMYLVDNPYRWDNTGQISRLYKIAPSELDGAPTTAVNLTHIGRTYMDDTNANEVHGLTFYQGKLYGVGAGNNTIYDISMVNGRANEVNTFTRTGAPRCKSRSDRDVDARSITADGVGNVYISRKCDGNETQIYKFDSFPDGDARYLMTVDAKLSGLGIHPDGYGYAYEGDTGRVHKIDMEAETSSVMGQSLSGDIEDMALYFAGEMAAMGLHESPRLNTFPVFEGHGTRTHDISWPSIGVVEVEATISRAWRAGRWTDSRIEGSTLKEFLDDARYHNGNSWNLSGKTVDRSRNLDVEFTGPAMIPTLNFTPSVGSRKSDERFAFTFPDSALADDLYLYVVDVDWADVEISAVDANGRAVSVNGWVKKESVDIVGTDDGKRTTLSRARNVATLSPNNYGIDGETLIDEIHIPNASLIHTLTLEVGSHGQRGDYLAFAFASRSLFEESGALAVSMSDRASIRYSSEAIGRLSPKLPTIAAASWFETFDQFATMNVDRMFDVKRRAEQATRRRPNATTGAGGTGTIEGNPQGSTVYVCHVDGASRSSIRVGLGSLESHITHGDTPGQCDTVRGATGRP